MRQEIRDQLEARREELTSGVDADGFPVIVGAESARDDVSEDPNLQPPSNGPAAPARKPGRLSWRELLRIPRRLTRGYTVSDAARRQRLANLARYGAQLHRHPEHTEELRRQILHLWVDENMTQTQIAERLGCTQSYVSQVLHSPKRYSDVKQVASAEVLAESMQKTAMMPGSDGPAYQQAAKYTYEFDENGEPLAAESDLKEKPFAKEETWQGDGLGDYESRGITAEQEYQPLDARSRRELSFRRTLHGMMAPQPFSRPAPKSAGDPWADWLDPDSHH